MGYKLDLVGITNDLRRDEGVKNKPYFDTRGKLTIGVGHNLTDNGISDAVLALMLQEDIANAIKACQDNIPWFNPLSDNRQKALVELCFNMGITKLLEFVKTLTYMQNGDYKLASQELLNSDWANEVGPYRSKYLSSLIANG